MKALLLFCVALSSLNSFAQKCATPLDCVPLQKAQQAEKLRILEQQKQEAFRQQQLQLQEAQLREMQSQRALLEEQMARREAERMEAQEAEIEKQEKAAELQREREIMGTPEEQNAQ